VYDLSNGSVSSDIGWRENLSFSQHIDAVVTVCNQTLLYLLAQLKRQGLDLSALDFVFNAIIANKILYALPV